jgi:hypothetical protein
VDNDAQAFIAFLRSLDGVRVEVTANALRVYAQPAHPIPKQQ